MTYTIILEDPAMSRQLTLRMEAAFVPDLNECLLILTVAEARCHIYKSPLRAWAELLSSAPSHVISVQIRCDVSRHCASAR
jgi:hypothetical protein